MIDRNHPAVEAANKAVKRAYGSHGGEALNYHATALRAALPHLESATEENVARLRDTTAGKQLLAEGWDAAWKEAWGQPRTSRARTPTAPDPTTTPSGPQQSRWGPLDVPGGAMTDHDFARAQSEIDAALYTLAKGGIPTAWVIVAAVAGEDGDDQLYTVTSPGLPFWQKHGLLSQGAHTSAGQPEWTIEEDE